MHKSPFVWLSDDGAARMAHAYFRREFNLTHPPQSAAIHLYADTHYHLFVNGVFVGAGPVRGYPEFPEYDSYDLAPFLQTGANVIGVHVLHVGAPSFHNLINRAGFMAWGEVSEGENERVSLSTEANWLALPARGYDPTTPALSFAQEPTQTYDERLDIANWNQSARPDGDWQPPTPVPNGAAWGELSPRSIPKLTQDELLPKLLLGAYAHTPGEEIVSFRLSQTPDANGGYPPARAFACTYIHSPVAQAVPVGTYWGEHYLNGKLLAQQPERPDQMLRNDAVFDFQAGWNFLLIGYGLVQGIWEMHLAVPTAAALTFSPDKSQDSDTAFLTAGPFPKDEADALFGNNPPASPDALAVQWTPQPRLPCAIAPQKALAWASFGPALDIPAWKVGGITLDAAQNASLILDMGSGVLGRIFLDYDAPAGTVIDIGGAEALRNGRPDYSRMLVLSMADRQIARGGPSRIETFLPRGFRYLQVSVSGHDSPVTLHKIGVVSQTYPYEKRGRFQCSDPFFNTLWEYGWNSLELCSEDVITDCPWRERTLYAGDLLPETATALAVSGDGRLPRRCLEIFLQSQHPETGGLQGMAPMPRTYASLGDYPLIALLITDWYCRFADDVEFARRAAPVYRRMLAGMNSLRGPNGLFTLAQEPFLDWIQIPKVGQLCAVNALIARALEAWASLLTMIGEDAEAAQARTLGRETADALAAQFWDTEKGAYADNIVDGQRQDSHFPLSSAWPLLAGASSPEQSAQSLAHMREVLSRFSAADCEQFTSPYGAFYLLGALYERGDAALAEDSMRRLYSDMIVHPTGTLWETFRPDWSQCHAWSSAPTYYLSTRALGVRLGFPDRTDLSAVLIAPESDTLAWARGSVPHPRGLVTVDWAIHGDLLRLNYQAPDGVAVTVAPQGRLAALRLWVNGQPRIT